VTPVSADLMIRKTCQLLQTFVQLVLLFTPLNSPVAMHLLYCALHSAASLPPRLHLVSKPEHVPWHPWAKDETLDATYPVAATAIVRPTAISAFFMRNPKVLRFYIRRAIVANN